MKPSSTDNDEFAKNLLSKCKYAVFEISETGRGGHFMEIAKARDQDIKSIGVYQSQEGKERSFSGMIDWLQKRPYSTLDGLKALLREFLSS